MTALDLRPVRVSVSPARRLTQLLAGLALYGASMAMMTRAGLGLAPWDVLHEGLTERTGLSFGTVVAIASVVVLLLWIPLRQRPGLGTVANVLVVSVTVDLVRAVLPNQHAIGWRIALMLGGIALNAFATAAYVGARLGPGPRDGLMTGLSARTGWSVRVVRTGIEVTVLAAGWLLGGTIGAGTVLYALAIGPLTQAILPRVAWRESR
ncbi:putative membrane protein YczE [Amycolatopsis endophytica]|uniref:Putative membrane protein YczE n=1 Tax=Amycolatopsis endophytica TaxID=860233 RepID=A0A853AZP5_9PSEU|nr:putative membrane protein YczE [Amycolatopsis endophytica]